MNISAKGVIFDLDGVLTDTARFHFVAWAELAKSLGIAIDEEFNETLKGVDRMTSLDRILAHGGVTLSQEEKVSYATKKNDHYRELIKEMTPADVLPGVIDRLEELKSRGCKIALASASKNATTILDAIGLTQYFDAIADVNAIAQNKPAPDIFLLAAKDIGLEPGDCLGVEDAIAGVEAIKSAGMVAIGIGDEKVLGLADHVFSDMTQFTFVK